MYTRLEFLIDLTYFPVILSVIKMSHVLQGKKKNFKKKDKTTRKTEK